MPYTEEQRAATLELYVEFGPHEASRQSGVPVRTISYWAAKAGLATEVASKNARAAEAVRARSRAVREQLRLMLLEQATAALLAMDDQVAKPITVIEGRIKTEHWEMVPPDPNDKKNLAITVGTLLDKYRLEVGEATGRTESTLIQGKSDHEQRVLADIINAELERRAYADASSDEAADSVEEPATPEPSPA